MGIVLKDQIVLHRWVLWFIARRLAKQLNIKNYILSGSYRRGKWWCNDIDLLIPIQSISQGEGIKARLRQLGWQLRPGRHHDRCFSDQYVKKSGTGYIVLDLFLSPPGTWGNALLFTTGSKEFNDGIRERMLENGYSWADPLYFTHIKTDRKLSFTDEKSALFFLGMKWIKPSSRI